MSSVCYNPFIYFWLNKHYNESARYLFKACLSMRCNQKSISPVSKESRNSDKNRNARKGNNNLKLKRTNALKVPRNRFEKRICGAACVRGSISTTSSSQDNNIINSIDNNGPVANQTIATGIVEESKL